MTVGRPAKHKRNIAGLRNQEKTNVHDDRLQEATETTAAISSPSSRGRSENFKSSNESEHIADMPDARATPCYDVTDTDYSRTRKGRVANLPKMTWQCENGRK
ncbi:hypothetical protein E1B28_003292, partial [Marasmius oreades]